METAKIFVNGRSQAVRLPKEYRFEGKEVYMKKAGWRSAATSKEPIHMESLWKRI